MLDERWSDEATAFADGLRDVLTGVCDSDAVREAEAAQDARNRKVEQALEAFGLWELPGAVELDVTAAWELGRFLAPVAWVETIAVRRLLDVDAGYGVEGPVPASCASAIVADADGGLHAVGVVPPAQRTAAGDLLVVPAEPVGNSAAIGDGESAGRLARSMRLLDAARMVGAAEGVLDLAVSYARERHQFGRAIGSFQSVAHRLVDARTAVDGAGLLVKKTTWVAAQERDSTPPQPFPSMVRWKAVSAAQFAAACAHQVMGGYGFALEYDAQLYSRRIRSWATRLGRPEAELADVAAQLLDPERRAELRWLWHHDTGVPLPRWAADLDGGTAHRVTRLASHSTSDG